MKNLFAIVLMAFTLSIAFASPPENDMDKQEVVSIDSVVLTADLLISVDSLNLYSPETQKILFCSSETKDEVYWSEKEVKAPDYLPDIRNRIKRYSNPKEILLDHSSGGIPRMCS